MMQRLAEHNVKASQTQGIAELSIAKVGPSST
jgi:hypothetical protein